MDNEIHPAIRRVFTILVLVAPFWNTHPFFGGVQILAVIFVAESTVTVNARYLPHLSRQVAGRNWHLPQRGGCRGFGGPDPSAPLDEVAGDSTQRR